LVRGKRVALANLAASARFNSKLCGRCFLRRPQLSI
jgi:hypothetical protein